MDPTCDPKLTSYLATGADSHFPLQNLPWGVFSPAGDGRR